MTTENTLLFISLISHRDFAFSVELRDVSSFLPENRLTANTRFIH